MPYLAGTGAGDKILAVLAQSVYLLHDIVKDDVAFYCLDRGPAHFGKGAALYSRRLLFYSQNGRLFASPRVICLLSLETVLAQAVFFLRSSRLQVVDS